MLSVRRMSVRARKRALWIGTAVSWGIAGVMVTLSMDDPEEFHLRTLVMVSLSIAMCLFATASIATLITGPDVAYRIGVEHGRAGSCDRCQPDLGTGTDGVVIRFPMQHTDN